MTSDAVIRYTASSDGSVPPDPTQSSTEYSGAISVSVTTTIKAKAFKADMAASDTVTAVFTKTQGGGGGTGGSASGDRNTTAEDVQLLCVTPNEHLTLQVTVSANGQGSVPAGASYQWQRNSAGGWTNIAGATQETYTDSLPENDTEYRCIISLPGGLSITSKTSRLQTDCGEGTGGGAVGTSGDTTALDPVSVTTLATYEITGSGAASIDAASVLKGYITQSLGTSNTADQTNKAIVFTTNKASADGRKESIAALTFELKTSDSSTIMNNRFGVLNLGKAQAGQEFYAYVVNTDGKTKKSSVALISENIKVNQNGYVRFAADHGADHILVPKEHIVSLGLGIRF